tara:strand:- start:1515 stop:3053 length:1539 start_codon:yes stop_codon:yes gene_type:complete
MKAYIQFAEDYLELTLDICNSIKKQMPNCQFDGITIRRKTCQIKVEKLDHNTGIEHTRWLNDIETAILNKKAPAYNLKELSHKIGSRNIRQIIAADREIGRGFLSGGLQESTPLTRKIDKEPHLRQQLVLGMIDYYLDYFNTHRPDFIFLNEITFYWELIIYHTATHLNIPCFTLLYLRPTEHYMITNNPFERCTAIENTYNHFLSNPPDADPYVVEAKACLNNALNSDSLPLASKQLKRKILEQASIYGLLKTIFLDIAKCAATTLGVAGTKGYLHQNNSAEILKTNLRRFILVRATLKKRSLFESFNTLKDTPYIFYPLHVEPESSILVRSEKFTNQLAFIEQVAKNMPYGHRLLVKEHLPMLGKRPPGFYERIKSLPDVHLINPLENGTKLVKNAKLVSVLTGTAGWEAIIRGIPTLLIGQAQYSSIRFGLHRTNNLIDLDQAIEKALQIPPAEKHQILLYIAAVIAAQTKMKRRDFAYHHYGDNYQKIRSEGGADQIAQQILNQLRPS